MSIPAGETVIQRLEFSFAVQPSLVREGRDLFDRSAWQMTLLVDIAPHVRMPIPILRPE